MPPVPLFERWLLALHRRPLLVAALAWSVVYMLSGWFETRTMQMEYARLGIDTDPWEIPTWQGTSALSSLMLVALVGWAEARWPLRWGELRHHLFLPLLNFEWVAARIDRSLGPLSEGT